MTIRSRSALAVFAVGLTVSGLSVPAHAAAPSRRPPETAVAHGRASLADRDGNRIADGLDRRLTRTSAVRHAVVVTFTDRSSMAAARSAVGRAHVSTTFSLIDGFAASLTDGQIRSLAHRPGVLRVEQNFAVHALDDASNDDFGITAARTSFEATGAGARSASPTAGSIWGTSSSTRRDRSGGST